MAASLFQPHLIDRLPEVRGRMTANAPLAQRTWFRVGGTAEVLFKPADRQDLIDFMRDCPRDVPTTVIGVASNLLVRDGGISGVVITLGGSFAEIHPLRAKVDNSASEARIISAGAGALDSNVAQVAVENGLTGLEFLCGIPGTIGGAVFMNAGCYGNESADVLTAATILLRDGTVTAMDKEDFGFSYRHSALPADAIVLDATFHVGTGDPAAIAARMAEIKAQREESQPTRARTGGSTFANPDGHKAWQLIDAAGCRGLKIGGAQMSEKHCNFMINTGDATAADLETLGEEVRARVLVHSGIDLRWEIQRVGVKA